MSGSLDLGAPSLLSSKPFAGHDLREPTLAIAVILANASHLKEIHIHILSIGLNLFLFHSYKNEHAFHSSQLQRDFHTCHLMTYEDQSSISPAWLPLRYLNYLVCSLVQIL